MLRDVVDGFMGQDPHFMIPNFQHNNADTKNFQLKTLSLIRQSTPIIMHGHIEEDERQNLKYCVCREWVVLQKINGTKDGMWNMQLLRKD